MSGAPGPLTGVGVLVTRPVDQAGRLAGLIEELGGMPVRFPTIEIRAPRDPAPALAIIDRLSQYTMAIFTSVNAVRYAVPLIRTRQGPPAYLIISVIGKASARQLELFGVSPQLVPSAGFSSEALLAMPRMQVVHGERIVIFRGEGGRELLGDTLKARGARVDVAEVYRRAMPETDPGELIQRWKQGEINIVIVTSNESLQNLFAIVGEVGQQWLCATPLVVVSERARRLAHVLGVGHPVLTAREASDEAIVETLLKWRQARFE
jgi:uroporphyrinogen-III synthase